jgi:hypothetical protein
MRIEAAIVLTLTISFTCYGKMIFDVRVSYLRAHFQERNYSVNREATVHVL